MTTRAEYIAWARERALAYLPDDTGQAVASMVSDLTKHPETAGIAFEEGQKMMPVLLDETSPPIQDVEKVRAWIEAIR